MFAFRGWIYSSLGIFAFLAVGCGPAPTGVVSGTVTVNGTPVANGLITFASEVGNKDSFSAAIQDGKYETGEIPVGPTKISIVNRGANPAAAPQKEAGGGDINPVKRPRPEIPKASSGTVPPHYSSPDSSGLTFDVAKGENRKDFDLR